VGDLNILFARNYIKNSARQDCQQKEDNLITILKGGKKEENK
jgi:hypothetical protein